MGTQIALVTCDPESALYVNGVLVVCGSHLSLTDMMPHLMHISIDGYDHIDTSILGFPKFLKDVPEYARRLEDDS